MKILASLFSLLSLWTGVHQACAFAPVQPAPLARPAAVAPTPLSIRSYNPKTSRHVLFMGWGPEPIWSTATVTEKADACNSGRSVLVKVQVSPDTAAEYKIPGRSFMVVWNGSVTFTPTCCETRILTSLYPFLNEQGNMYSFARARTRNLCFSPLHRLRMPRIHPLSF